MEVIMTLGVLPFPGLGKRDDEQLAGGGPEFCFDHVTVEMCI